MRGALQAPVRAMHSTTTINNFAVCVTVLIITVCAVVTTAVSPQRMGASSCGHPMNETALGGRNLKASFLDPTHNVTTCCLACDRTAGCVAWTGSCPWGGEAQLAGQKLACMLVVVFGVFLLRSTAWRFLCTIFLTFLLEICGELNRQGVMERATP